MDPHLEAKISGGEVNPVKRPRSFDHALNRKILTHNLCRPEPIRDPRKTRPFVCNGSGLVPEVQRYEMSSLEFADIGFQFDVAVGAA